MAGMWLRSRVVVAVCCVVGGLLAGVPAAAAASGTGSVYVPVGPVRVLDTRNAIGVTTKTPVGPGGMISVQVTGANGVPSSGVTAVVLNVTATGPTASSFVTVWPDGQAQPSVSNLNFTAGETIANLVTVPVGADGAVDFFNSAGSVNLVADLAGYYSDTGSGSLLGSLGPVRVLDTRNAIGVTARTPVGAGAMISLQVAGVAGVPAAGVSAVVLNVTATGPTASSFVTVWPDGSTRPVTSDVNFTAGETIANLVVVPVGSDGKVDFYNSAGSVNLVADLSGYYTVAGAGFAPLGPVRVMDTRNGTGVPKAPVGAGGTVSLQLTGADGVPAAGVTAVVLNVTATGPTAASFITVYPDGSTRPNSSNVNFTAGETIPNLVVVPVGADGKVDFYNSTGSVSLVADLAGYYTAGGPTWSNAIGIPGLAAQEAAANANLTSLSCPSAGNCTAGGLEIDSSGNQQAFVADEVNGTWGNAIVVPGTAALDAGGGAVVISLSCPSAGNCAAGGFYADSSGSFLQVFVADEVNGVWGDAIELPGLAALNTADIAFVNSVSCASAGNCAIGGLYDSTSAGLQAFVADEVDGTWDDAITLPGAAALNGSITGLNSVSCVSAGNCTAGGYYADSSLSLQAYVAEEVDGSWGNAVEIPGTAALNTGGSAQVNSVLCTSAGNCTVGGQYTDSSSNVQAFVADEVGGTWGNAIEVPGSATLNTGGRAQVDSVSCVSSGNCAAGGEVTLSSSGGNSSQPFVVSEVDGTWGNAIQIPGFPPGLVPGTSAGEPVSSVSCTSAGNCVDANGGFLVSEVNGTWGEAIPVPGVSGLVGEIEVNSVSCPPAGGCTAGGAPAFVVSQN